MTGSLINSKEDLQHYGTIFVFTFGMFAAFWSASDKLLLSFGFKFYTQMSEYERQVWRGLA